MEHGAKHGALKRTLPVTFQINAPPRITNNREGAPDPGPERKAPAVMQKARLRRDGADRALPGSKTPRVVGFGRIVGRDLSRRGWIES